MAVPELSRVRVDQGAAAAQGEVEEQRATEPEVECVVSISGLPVALSSASR